MFLKPSSTKIFKATEAKVCYISSICNALGKTKDVVRMKMSGLLNDIGESLKDQEHLASANQGDADNVSQERNGSEEGVPKLPNSPRSYLTGAAGDLVYRPPMPLAPPVLRALSPTLPLLVPRHEASPLTTPSLESELKAKQSPEPSQLSDTVADRCQRTGL
ncbi:hypothetical protein N7534_000763 [Penicillium rubens]|nr:hypothetical protein N7534_000763 [Penicillium rubens]